MASVTFLSISQNLSPIELPKDCVEKIMRESLVNGTKIATLSSVNTQWNEWIAEVVRSSDTPLSVLCLQPGLQGLRILDAKTMGLAIPDEPEVNKMELIRTYLKVVRFVENKKGGSLVTVPANYSIESIFDLPQAKENKMIPSLCVYHRPGFSNPVVRKTYRVLITNGCIENTKKADYDRKKKIIENFEFEIPTAAEYFFLCFFSYTVFKKVLYGNVTATPGCSSTKSGGLHFSVGMDEHSAKQKNDGTIGTMFSVPAKEFESDSNAFDCDGMGAVYRFPTLASPQD